MQNEYPEINSNIESKELPINPTRGNLKKNTENNSFPVVRKDGSRPTFVNSVAKYGNMFVRKTAANSDCNNC
jgi:Tol biopolymer transport system component